MGLKNSKKSEENQIIGEDIIASIKDLINNTETILSRNKKNKSFQTKQSNLAIKNSIEQDLTSLKKLVYKGNGIKLGILGRSKQIGKLVDTLFLPEEKNNYFHTTFISSDFNDSNILIENDLNNATNNSLTKLLNFYLGSNGKLTTNIKLAKYYPTPEIINQNLITTLSPTLKPLKKISDNIDSVTDFNIEIDFDDINKYLLFSILHDVLVYIPDESNIDNEITYLDYIADNMLILKLLRRDNFLVILDKKKNKSNLINKEFLNLVVKLGKTVTHELNYSDAESDKIKYLGSLIEKKGVSYLKNVTCKEVENIKNRFDRNLKNEDYKNYLEQKKKEEDDEQKKKQKNPSYKLKEIYILPYDEFKAEYCRAFSDNFVTSSGIDKLEDHLLQSFLKILDNKISIIRSTLAFKFFLLDNLSGIESNNDFSNLIIFTRNEIVDDMNMAFQNVRDLVKLEENNLLRSCEDLMETMIGKKILYENNVKGITDSFWDIFNISGNFAPSNYLISESRTEYYSFNRNIFTILTKVCNNCYKIFEILSKNISNKYTNLFIELENKQSKSFIQSLMTSKKGSSDSSTEYYNRYGNFPIDQIIKSKLEKINHLSLHLLSIFGNSNFNLTPVFSYYCLPAYGGTSFFTIMLISAFSSKNPLFLSSIGAVVCSLSLIFSYYLKNKFITDSKDNFMKNINQMINFLSIKKEKILDFELVLNDFIQVYSKEVLELIDFLSGIQ